MQERHLYEFGPFRLDCAERVLYRDGRPVALPPKDLETLILLVEKRGHIVEKEELLERVWPGVFVEEGNLARRISNLRQFLTDRSDGRLYIETVPKRGYRFVASVQVLGDLASGEAPREAPASGVSPEAGSNQDDRGTTPGARPSRRERRRGWRIALGVAGALALAVGAFGLWITRSQPVLSFAPRDWILVTDFENRTGDARFDKALLTAFIVDLEQSRHANVFPRSRIVAALQRMGKAPAGGTEAAIDEALGREICLRENLRGLITASITRTGQQYLLVARLVDPQTGSAVMSYSERRKGEDGILDALDSIAASLRRDLGETLYAIRRSDKPLPQVTTASLEALQHYAEGAVLWNKGNYNEAQVRLHSALRADPDFVMAHAFLAANYYSHIFSDPVKGREHYERALALSGRVTERERMHIQAAYARDLGHVDDAIRLHENYLRAYPDDLSGQFNLASLLMRANRLEEAARRYQEMLRIDPRNPKALINVATCYNMMGGYTEALSFYQRGFELQPDWITSENLNHEYGYALVGAGQLEKAREVFTLMLGKPNQRFRGLRSLALLDLYEGKYKAAQPFLAEAIRINERAGDRLAAARNHFFLSRLLEGQGDRAGEARELSAAMKDLQDLKGNAWLGSHVGVAAARAGRLGEAERILIWVRDNTDRKSSKQARDEDRLEGEVALATGNVARAIVLLAQADQESSSPLTVESLARAYDRAGRHEEAISQYESLLKRFGESIGWEAQQPWLAAHIALAEDYAARGDVEAASVTAKELLRIWKDADAGLPLLQKAHAILGPGGN